MNKKKKIRGSMTWEEWEKVRDADPELKARWLATQERQKIEERKRLAWSAVLGENEAPLVAELRKTGFDVDSVWMPFNRKEPWRTNIPIPPYPEAIPILVRHVQLPYHCTIRQGIIRALICPHGRGAFYRIVEEFRLTRDTGQEEIRRAIETVEAGLHEVYTRDDRTRMSKRDRESYRDAIASAIG